MELLYRGRQLFRAWHSMPLSYQFTISPEYENAEIRCSFRFAKLRRHGSIKIGRNENVLPCVTCNFLSVISPLQLFRFFVNSVPDERGGDLPPNHSVPSRKTDNRDHPVIRTAEAPFRNTITHRARLFPICRRRQHDYSHMSVPCRMFVSVNIDKTERVICSDGQSSM